MIELEKELEKRLNSIKTYLLDIKKAERKKPLSDEQKDTVKKIYREYKRYRSEFDNGEADFATLSILDTIAEEAFQIAYPRKKYRKPQMKRKEAFKPIVVVYVILALFIFVQACVIGVSPVSGESMTPTYENGDIILVRRFLTVGNLDRGDIVIVKEESRLLIKRIIGLPDETICIGEDDKIYINGEPINDRFGKANNGRMYTGKDVVLGDNEYFLLGDNREHSSDSRTFGPVTRKQIYGKVVGKVF